MLEAVQQVGGPGAAENTVVSRADVIALPKAHLHLHFAGSVPPASLAEMETKAGRRLSVPARFDGLTKFLGTYSEVVGLIRDVGDLRALAGAIALQEHRQGVVYFEPSISPRTFSEAHGSPERVLADAIEGFAEAEERFGVGFGVMVSGYWHSDADMLLADARLAARFADKGVTAFGIAGDETAPWDERAALRACAIARDAGLAIVPHAGEARGAHSVARVIDLLNPERIAHGIRALEDAQVLNRVAESGVVLDVCPTSNLATGVLPGPWHLRLDMFRAAGVPVTVNADDSLLFGVQLCDEYSLVANTFRLDRSGLAELARNSIARSTATAARKAAYLQRCELWERATSEDHGS